MGAPRRPRRRVAPAAAALCPAAAALCLLARPHGSAQGRPRQSAHAGALVPPPPSDCRRRLLAGWAAGALLGGAGCSRATAPPIAACPLEANNCYSSASTGRARVRPWRWPSGRSREEAIADLRKVVESYPQKGQSGVDKGGWKVVVDDLKGADEGYMRLEFTSGGKGRFAKQYNEGRPFQDDMELVVEAQFVTVRSSSRIGRSDFGVNAKRLNYFTKALREKGWDARDVKELE